MSSPVAELRAFFRAALVERVERGTPPAEEPRAILRRRVVVGVTIVAGAGVLGAALAIEPGDALFYPATGALALVWALGAFASGPIHLGHARRRDGGTSRAALQGAILGLLLLGLFLAGGLIIGRTGWLIDSVQDLLDHARFGSLWAVIGLHGGIREAVTILTLGCSVVTTRPMGGVGSCQGRRRRMAAARARASCSG